MIATNMDFMDDDNSIYLSGTSWETFLAHIHSTIWIMILLTIVAFFAREDEGTIYIAAILIICSQIFWQYKDQNEKEALKAQRHMLAEKRREEAQRERESLQQTLLQCARAEADKKTD
eukprot:Blabericola_migrator_1__10006@NODE_553_length_7646_cov_26_017417_g416_i0_p7_GENE_NODE_553_length_7646_cov_26_017417_g416_i0NODE_553_length_7646_cov_26_017417_g416_i0_p7_ORF_typecomplete_len118_score21_88MCLC/PF05934_11/0_072GRIM19/PF06212_12/1_5FtsL/PF04999_13/8_2e02FtsL/PF04999_13/3_4_NODE_553_length_7646_cov_26_017417_g416_i058411